MTCSSCNRHAHKKHHDKKKSHDKKSRHHHDDKKSSGPEFSFGCDLHDHMKKCVRANPAPAVVVASVSDKCKTVKEQVISGLQRLDPHLDLEVVVDAWVKAGLPVPASVQQALGDLYQFIDGNKNSILKEAVDFVQANKDKPELANALQSVYVALIPLVGKTLSNPAIQKALVDRVVAFAGRLPADLRTAATGALARAGSAVAAKATAIAGLLPTVFKTLPPATTFELLAPILGNSVFQAELLKDAPLLVSAVNHQLALLNLPLSSIPPLHRQVFVAKNMLVAEIVRAIRQDLPCDEATLAKLQSLIAPVQSLGDVRGQVTAGFRDIQAGRA